MFGNNARAKTRDIETPGPDYPEANPKYPGNSGISGCKPGVSGFSQAPENWTELESIFGDSICTRKIRSLIN